MNIEKKFNLMREDTSLKTLTAFFWYNGIPVRESDARNLFSSIVAQREECSLLDNWRLKKVFFNIF